MKYIKKGWGFHVGQNFARASNDIPCNITAEYAKPGYTIGYIAPIPDSALGFLRHGGEKGIRIHVVKAAIATGDEYYFNSI